MTKSKPITLSVHIDPEIDKGKYVNFVTIEPEEGEIFLSFTFLQPAIDAVRKGEVRSRVILTPTNLKKTIFKLLEWLTTYEKEYGRIQLKNQPTDNPEISQ